MRHLRKLHLGLILGFVSTSVGIAVAGGQGGGPNPAVAAKIAGIQQLVADYVQFVDWGPQSDVPPNNGVNDTEVIGNLFTENGNFTVYYWNSGNPVPLSWHPATGPSYDGCDNVGPAAVARFFGGPGSFPR